MLTEVDMLTECMMVSLLQMTTTVSEVTPQWSSHYRGLFPQRSSAILQYYDTFHFRYHGFPAVLPLFPLPCSSLARDEELHQPDQFTATVLLTMQVMTMLWLFHHASWQTAAIQVDRLCNCCHKWKMLLAWWDIPAEHRAAVCCSCICAVLPASTSPSHQQVHSHNNSYSSLSFCTTWCTIHNHIIILYKWLAITEVRSKSFRQVTECCHYNGRAMCRQSYFCLLYVVVQCNGLHIFIVECGISRFPRAMCVFDVWASSSSPRLPLCQISFLSHRPLLN